MRGLSVSFSRQRVRRIDEESLPQIKIQHSVKQCISLEDRKTTERQRFSEETQRSQWLYRWLLDWMFTSFALFSWLCFFSFWPLYPWRQNDLKSPEKCSVYLTGMFIFWNASPSWLTRMIHMLLQVHLEANGLYQQPVQESNVSFWFVCVSKAIILLFNNILLCTGMLCNNSYCCFLMNRQKMIQKTNKVTMKKENSK